MRKKLNWLRTFIGKRKIWMVATTIQKVLTLKEKPERRKRLPNLMLREEVRKLK
jgi:hypothetical protein